MSKSSIRITLFLVGLVVFLRVSLGPWGWVGSGDARLYQDVARCAEAPPKHMVQACFRPSHSSAMFPVAVVGVSSKLLSVDSLSNFLRLWSGLFAVLALLLVFHLARTKNRPQDGFAAVFLLLLGTPLVERASAGGPEVWSLTLLLGMAWLLGQIQRKTLYALLSVLVSCFLLSSHPYAGPVLFLILFVPLFQSRPLGPRVIGGRIWFGWIEARYLCAAVGGLALFVLFWPGSSSGGFLWHYLSDVYRDAHPAFLVGGEPWIQEIQYASPPWWSSPLWILLSLPLLTVPFFVAAFSDLFRRVGPSLGPSEVSLILMAFGWWGICILQGSPVADGQDHRLILLGLLIPFAGRSFHWVEKLAGRLADWGTKQGHAWVQLGRARLAFLLFVLMIAPSMDTFWSGTAPTSVFVGERSGFSSFGLSAYARPEVRTEWMTSHRGIPRGCQPWASLCQKELLPGLEAMGFLEKGEIARSEKDAGILIVPKDPTYPKELDAVMQQERAPEKHHLPAKWASLVEIRVLQP